MIGCFVHWEHFALRPALKAGFASQMTGTDGKYVIVDAVQLLPAD
jgi:hypothetical protein